MQLAALKDTGAAYMSKLPGASLLTPELLRELNQIGAVVSNHPDEMYRDKYNPDLANYNVTKVTYVVSIRKYPEVCRFASVQRGTGGRRIESYPNH